MIASRIVKRLALIALVGCSVSRPTFECGDFSDCGPGGYCEPGTNACSFADKTCVVSGRRFSTISPDPYRDKCVEFQPDAPAGAACNETAPTCASLRACVGGRCVSTVDLDTGKLLTCARCAIGQAASGPLWCWGESTLTAPIAPQYFPIAGQACPAFCPPECNGCPTMATPCEATCDGSVNTFEYALGEDYLCYTNGRTYCLGSNSDYQLGEGYPTVFAPGGALTVRLANNYDKIAASRVHTCARAQSNRVFCWGNNDHGQLRLDNTPGPAQQNPVGNAPFVPIDTIVGVDFVAVSAEFSCAASNNDVVCWGEVPWGPGIVAGLPPGQITDFDVGFHHACVVKGGKAVCWGNNRQGQADPAAPSMLAVPTIVMDAKRVVTGRVHSCAITTSGELWCWGGGDGSGMQLDGAPGPGPVLVRRDPPAVGPIAAGDDVTCAVHADDRVRCFGDVLQTNGQEYREFPACTR
jgi:hypothetical protein